MRRQFYLLLPLLLLTFYSLAACSLLSSDQPDDGIAPPVAESSPTPTNTPAAAITPDVALSSVVTQTRTTLTVWVPPSLWAATEAGQTTLLNQIDAYRAGRPDLDIHVEPKAVTGQGSILNYLRSGKTIAPTILPDLIALPTDQLSSAASESLIVPLDGFVEIVYFEDVYNAGLELVTWNDQIIGYPFLLTNPPHLAYESSAPTATVPVSWTEFIDLPGQDFVFPAAGPPGATLLLMMYLDAGGQLTNEAGQTELQLEPLVTALQQLGQGRENGFILPESSNLQTLEETWPVFQSGAATHVQTNANQFLIQRDATPGVGFAAIPGMEESLPPLVSGWAWAISSPDASKREEAANLLKFLVEGQNLGEWSFQSKLLPGRQGALFYWPAEDPYTVFISDQLLLAQAHPFTPNHPVMLALSDAVFDVISLAKSPQVAAEEAISTLQP